MTNYEFKTLNFIRQQTKNFSVNITETKKIVTIEISTDELQEIADILTATSRYKTNRVGIRVSAGTYADTLNDLLNELTYR